MFLARQTAAYLRICLRSLKLRLRHLSKLRATDIESTKSSWRISWPYLVTAIRLRALLRALASKTKMCSSWFQVPQSLGVQSSLWRSCASISLKEGEHSQPMSSRYSCESISPASHLPVEDSWWNPAAVSSDSRALWDSVLLKRLFSGTRPAAATCMDVQCAVQTPNPFSEASDAVTSVFHPRVQSLSRKTINP